MYTVHQSSCMAFVMLHLCQQKEQGRGRNSALAHPCLWCSAGTTVPVRFWPWDLCRQHTGRWDKTIPIRAHMDKARFSFNGVCQEQRQSDWKPRPDESSGSLLASASPYNDRESIKIHFPLTAGQSTNSQINFLLVLYFSCTFSG